MQHVNLHLGQRRCHGKTSFGNATILAHEHRASGTRANGGGKAQRARRRRGGRAGAPDISRQKIAFFRTVCISTLSAFALAHSACAVSPLIDKIDITVQTRGRTDFWNLPIGVWEYFVEVLLFTLKSRQEMPLHRSYCRRGVANSLSTSNARMGQGSVM